MSTAPAILRDVKITNPDRVVYRIRGELVTKLDVARYIDKVAPLMLPHVRGRPLTIVRCRDGSEGAGFFQKHVMKGMPAPIDSMLVAERKGVNPCLKRPLREGRGGERGIDDVTRFRMVGFRT